MSRWYWFFQNLKETFKSLVTKDSSKRYWVVTQDRLEALTDKEKEFEFVKSEAEMYRTISKLYHQKYREAVQYIKLEWGKYYEK